MLDWISRMLLGPASDAAADLRADVELLDRPGRAPQWTGGKLIKVRAFNAKAHSVEPFFNHVEDDTACRKAA